MALRTTAVAAPLTAGLAAAGVAGFQAAALSPATVAPLAASVALVAAAPVLPSARSSAVSVGYLIAVGSGLLAGLVLTDTFAIPVAAGIAVGLMLITDQMHPPAVAAGCLIASLDTRSLAVAAVTLLGAGLIAAGCWVVAVARDRTTASA
jgi:hypothetical protein